MRYVRHLIIGALLMRRGYRIVSLGQAATGCSWKFCPDGLNAESVVYSGGVGKDITFEHALVRDFGCMVNLVDPSPTGLTTMALPQNKIPQFRFSPVALAGRCGTLRFAPPISDDEGSWFSTRQTSDGIEVPCLDLASLLKQNQHQRVDLLKLDIEGAEYEVLDNILDTGLPVRQILVEFHDGLLPGIRLHQTVRAMFRLATHGYKLIAELGTTYAFIR